MKFRRQMFHTEGTTDVRRLREEAGKASLAGEPVLLHLHPYDDLFDGCAPEHGRQKELHEEYVPTTNTPRSTA